MNIIASNNDPTPTNPRPADGGQADEALRRSRAADALRKAGK